MDIINTHLYTLALRKAPQKRIVVILNGKIPGIVFSSLDLWSDFPTVNVNGNIVGC